MPLNAAPKDPKGLQYNSHIGSVARGASINLVGLAVGQGLKFITQFALARMYGPAQLGFYILGMTAVGFAGMLAQFGIDNGVVRYVAEYRTKRETARLRGVILLSLGVTFALSLLFACLLFFGAGFLANRVFDKPFLETILKAFSIVVPIYVLMSIALWATQGFETVKYQAYIGGILQPLIALTLIIVFYLLGVQIFGAVVATMLSMAVGSIVALYYLKQLLPELYNRSTPVEFDSRALFSVSMPMGVFNLARWVNETSPIVVVGIFATAQDVGIYNVAVRTGTLPMLVLAAFSGIFNPIISSLYSTGSLHNLALLYRDICRWIFAVSLVIFLTTVLLARDILVIFGEEFVYGWPVLVLIAAAQLFDCSVGPTNRILAMTGNQRLLMLAILASSVVNLAGSIALVPTYGVLGAAFATATAIILFNITAIIYVKRLLGTWPYSHSYLKLLVAGLAAASATFLVRLALPLPDGLLALIVLSPILLTSFVAVALALGLSTNDREFFTALWTAVQRIVRS